MALLCPVGTKGDGFDMVPLRVCVCVCVVLEEIACET